MNSIRALTKFVCILLSCTTVVSSMGCTPTYCGLNGVCKDVNGFPTCTCNDGYYGLTCMQSVAETCSNYQCVDGECVMGDIMPECRCNEGAYGIQCDKKVSELCENYECKNGGKCYSKLSFPACNCVGNYTGSHCETAPSLGGGDCLMQCSNGGTCTLRVPQMTFYCKCVSGFSGELCKTVNGASGLSLNVCLTSIVAVMALFKLYA